MNKEAIEGAVRAALQPQELEIRDRSEAHAGHAAGGEGGHFELRIVSDKFSGLNPLARHRLVYAAVDGIGESIHAFALQTLTPEEAEARAQKRPQQRTIPLSS
ncbi:BolA family protein [Acidithiobacillus sp. IBUN Pt1247-S3]|uniref:BolA family protein n=1 Tax=Acidithiobacillus sp. IBUN Pt1247-S3 TaxID=3166642 RepID=UPI0034E516DB